MSVNEMHFDSEPILLSAAAYTPEGSDVTRRIRYYDVNGGDTHNAYRGPGVYWTVSGRRQTASWIGNPLIGIDLHSFMRRWSAQVIGDELAQDAMGRFPFSVKLMTSAPWMADLIVPPHTHNVFDQDTIAGFFSVSDMVGREFKVWRRDGLDVASRSANVVYEGETHVRILDAELGAQLLFETNGSGIMGRPRNDAIGVTYVMPGDHFIFPAGFHFRASEGVRRAAIIESRSSFRQRMSYHFQTLESQMFSRYGLATPNMPYKRCGLSYNWISGGNLNVAGLGFELGATEGIRFKKRGGNVVALSVHSGAVMLWPYDNSRNSLSDKKEEVRGEGFRLGPGHDVVFPAGSRIFSITPIEGVEADLSIIMPCMDSMSGTLSSTLIPLTNVSTANNPCIAVR